MTTMEKVAVGCIVLLFLAIVAPKFVTGLFTIVLLIVAVLLGGRPFSN